MSSIKIEMKGGEFFEELAEEIPAALERGVFRAAVLATGILAEKTRELFNPGTGDLSRSFQSAPMKTQKRGVFSAEAFSELSYAGIQDRGGRITPKSGKNLAIPLGRSMPRGTWPRNFSGELQWIPSKNPRFTGFLVQNVRSVGRPGARKTIFDLKFGLKRFVDLRGRDYTGKALPEIASEAAEILGDSFAIAVSKVGD